MATAAMLGAPAFGNYARLAAQQRLSQDQLLEFDTSGNVTLIHLTDIHAQMKPVYLREPEINLGVGLAKGLPGANLWPTLLLEWLKVRGLLSE